MIRKAAILAIVLSGSAIATAQANAQTIDLSREVEFQISSQRLADAMLEFSDQSGVQVISSGNDVVGITTTGLKGKHSVSDGLRVLLHGTGLSFNIVNDHTITIHTSRPENTASEGDDDVHLRLAQDDRSAQSAAASQKSEAADAKKHSDVDSDVSEGKIQEIVVTAQKREERLIDVPISMTVLGGRDMDRSTDRSVADALNRVPGVITAMSNASSRAGSGNGQVVVRGVAPANIGSSTAAYYLDSIPFGFVRSAYAPDVAAYDLEHVEVLRGPQGTLYGLSALNGVVRVLTKDADLERFAFKARASTSSTQSGSENYRGDMAVNVPIIEGKLAARAVVGYQDWGGWIDKPALQRKDANDSQIGTYRLKINAQPTERLSVGLFAWLSRSDISQPPITADGKTNSSAFEEPSAFDYDAYGFKVGYDFSNFTVNSTTSYIAAKFSSAFDYTPFVPTESTLNGYTDNTVFSQEVVVNSNREGAWRWSLGALYRDAEETGWGFRSLYTAPSVNDSISKSIAVFGETTRAFLDGRLELTGGLRYFEDHVRDVERSRSFGLIGGTINPTTGLPGLAPDQRNQFEKVTPRLVLTWHPTGEATLYASYAEGFRSGLVQFSGVRASAPQYPSAEPDDLKNYEIGAKWSLWNGRINFDTAAFYMDWKGVQQLVSVYIAPTLLSGAIINAGSASGGGFEFGVSAEPTDGLTLAATFSWNNLAVDRDVLTGAGAVFLPKGTRLNFSPAYTMSTSADYAFPLGGSGLKGRVSAAANYLPGMISGFTVAGAVQQAGASAILMTCASAGIESGDRWTASLYVDNLMNENGVMFDPFSRRWDTYLRPRTVGLQLEYRY